MTSRAVLWIRRFQSLYSIIYAIIYGTYFRSYVTNYDVNTMNINQFSNPALQISGSATVNSSCIAWKGGFNCFCTCVYLQGLVHDAKRGVQALYVIMTLPLIVCLYCVLQSLKKVCKRFAMQLAASIVYRSIPMKNIAGISLLLFLLAATCVRGKRVIRAAENAEKTGLYIVKLHKETGHEVFEKTRQKALSLSDDKTERGLLKHEGAFKFFTVKLDEKALDEVCMEHALHP